MPGTYKMPPEKSGGGEPIRPPKPSRRRSVCIRDSNSEDIVSPMGNLSKVLGRSLACLSLSPVAEPQGIELGLEPQAATVTQLHRRA